jgi:hypothetical protein
MDGLLPRPRLLCALLAAALLSCAFALAPAAARADDTSSGTPAATWPTGGSTLHLLLQMGTGHWGMTPCGGRVSIAWGALDPSLNAQSSWVNPVDDFAQPSLNSDCQITLSTGTWWDWPKLCTVVVHEIGHLTGHDHVADPADIMYFAYVQPAPECAATPEPVETGPPTPPTPPPAAPRAVAKKVVKKTKRPAKKHHNP